LVVASFLGHDAVAMRGSYMRQRLKVAEQTEIAGQVSDARKSIGLAARCWPHPQHQH